MRSTAHGSALHGGGAGVVGVNLDNPAKTVGFIWVLDRVKARIMLVPAVAATAFFQPPALLVLGDVVTTAKVVDEVFFRRQVSAPRGDAAGAIVQGP